MSGGAAPLDGLRHMALKTTTPENAPARFRICTDDFPPRERALAWRELYGRSVLRLEIEPLSDAPFSSELLISQMPDLGVARGHASPFRVGRTRELLTDGDDGLVFQITDVAGRAAQLGHDVDVAANEAVLLSCADIGSFTFPASCKVLALRLRRAALAPLVRNVDAMLVRPVPAQNEALRLLTRYIGVLDEAPPASAAVARWRQRISMTLPRSPWVPAKTRRSLAGAMAYAPRGAEQSKPISATTCTVPSCRWAMSPRGTESRRARCKRCSRPRARVSPGFFSSSACCAPIGS
jgi:AraC-like protein